MILDITPAARSFQLPFSVGDSQALVAVWGLLRSL